MRASLFLALVALGSTARSDEPAKLETVELETVAELTNNRAATLAQAAGLPPIAASRNETELRVWRDVGVIGLVSGWVVTPDGVHIYSSDWTEDHEVRYEGSVRLVRRMPPHHVREMLASFRRFESLDGRTIMCPVKDGAGLFIEAKYGERIFAFAALNPGRCDVPGGRPLWRAFRRLSALAPEPL